MHKYCWNGGFNSEDANFSQTENIVYDSTKHWWIDSFSYSFWWALFHIGSVSKYEGMASQLPSHYQCFAKYKAWRLLRVTGDCIERTWVRYWKIPDFHFLHNQQSINLRLILTHPFHTHCISSNANDWVVVEWNGEFLCKNSIWNMWGICKEYKHNMLMVLEHVVRICMKRLPQNRREGYFEESVIQCFYASFKMPNSFRCIKFHWIKWVSFIEGKLDL